MSLISDNECVDPMFKSREQQHVLLTYRLGCLTTQCHQVKDAVAWQWKQLWQHSLWHMSEK
jgi:hypothetical protein